MSCFQSPWLKIICRCCCEQFHVGTKGSMQILTDKIKAYAQDVNINGVQGWISKNVLSLDAKFQCSVLVVPVMPVTGCLEVCR